MAKVANSSEARIILKIQRALEGCSDERALRRVLAYINSFYEANGVLATRVPPSDE